LYLTHTVANESVLNPDLVLNHGDSDRATGYFGGIFVRDTAKKVATVYTVGDCEDYVKEASDNIQDVFVPFVESNEVDALTDDGWEFWVWKNVNTQFERIMEMVIRTFMQDISPIHVVNYINNLFIFSDPYTAGILFPFGNLLNLVISFYSWR